MRVMTSRDHSPPIPQKNSDFEIKYDSDNDAGRLINIRRTKQDGKFVCPVICSKGKQCGRLVKKLSLHIHNGHGPNGNFYYISQSGNTSEIQYK